jgi:hypothetical protein
MQACTLSIKLPLLQQLAQSIFETHPFHGLYSVSAL